MKTKAIIPLALGLLIGIFAIKLFVDKLASAKAGNQPAETVDVVVATTHINATMDITESMMKVVSVPKALVPDGTFETVEEVSGRVTSNPIPKGVPVLEALLAPPGTPIGLAGRLEEGYRAIAVKVNEFAAVGGWIKPGSRVDLICTLNSRSRAGKESRMLLQDVRILTVGDKIESDESGAEVSRSVTLELTPEQALKVQLAQMKGSLSLSLRNSVDKQVFEEVVANDTNLFEEPRSEDAEPRRTFLSGLFSKERKFDLGSPDKETKTQAEVKPVEVKPEPKPPVIDTQLLMAAAAPDPWTVEVISATRIETVAFENDQANARRVDEKALNANKRNRVPTQVNIPAPPQPQQRRPSLEKNPLPSEPSAEDLTEDVSETEEDASELETESLPELEGSGE